MKYSLYFFLTLLISFQSYAKAIDIRQVRLAKAQSLMLAGEKERALQLIYHNIKGQSFHTDSYLYLARYYFDQKNFKKSFKIYYTAAKKLDSKKLTHTSFGTGLVPFLKRYRKPNREALKIYFEIAQAYYKLFKNQFFYGKYNNKVLLLAKKYFTITQYYQYKKGEALLYLAEIASSEKKHKKAIHLSREAKKALIKKPTQQEEEKAGQADILLGESLIRDGFTDAGTIHFRAIHHNTSPSESLKQYAAAYVDTLSKGFSSFKVSLGTTIKNNIHELTDTQLSEFKTNSDLTNTYGEQKGALQIYKVGGLVGRQLGNHWSTLLNGSFINEKATSKSAQKRDLRDLTLGAEIRYDNFRQAITRLKYSLNYLWTRPQKEAKLEKNAHAHTLTPEYSPTFKFGSLTFGLPITFSQKNNLSKNGFAGQVSFRPFWHNQYFESTFLTSLGRRSEGKELPDSTIFILSASNYSQINTKWSLLSTVEWSQYFNLQNTLDFAEAILTATFSYTFKKIKGLSWDIGIVQKERRRGDNAQISVSELTTGLSYNF